MSYTLPSFVTIRNSYKKQEATKELPKQDYLNTTIVAEDYTKK